MNSCRVLFVDDEPNILSGFRRMLRGHIQDWELFYAGSGAEALELLKTTEIDVIITDMRMPGMDGAQLLAAVRQLHPSTTRLILSGQGDRESIISAVGPTQQFLTKPCEPEVLVGAISRVLAVRDLVSDERLRSILGDIDTLPKPPGIHEQMMEVASRPNCGISDVVAVVESDLSLCADILRLVNSAFFGLSSRIESIERAASLLGLDTIHALAISGKVFGAGAPVPRNLDVTTLRNNSMRIAGLARTIATKEGWPRETVSQTFLTALLRDLGLLVLAGIDPDGYDLVRRVPPEDIWAVSQAELAAFGCTVPEASAYLLGLWGFAEPVIQAMACQPAQISGPPVSPIAHAVGFAHRRLHQRVVEAEPDPDSWLDPIRTARWNALCADLEESVSEST